MHRLLPPLALALLALPPLPLMAQDAARGARLYLGLPGGEVSCVECHGPDPGLDRNRLLNAARGPAAIDEALRKAAAMGYLADLLAPADRADLSAFLALVSAQVEGATVAEAWPWGLEFGRLRPGAAVAPQVVRLHNRSAGPVALAPRLREWVPGGAAGLSLAHDCPALLPPGAGCAVQLSLVAPGAGRVLAALDWGDGGTALRPVGVAATVDPDAAGVARWADAGGDSLGLEAPARGEAVAVLTLRNEGLAPLLLGVPAITGPGRAHFRLEGTGGADACGAGALLPPGAACGVRLRAVAPASGVAEAVLQWRNDGVHAPLRRLAVQAVASTLPPAAPPVVTPPPAAPAPSPAPAPPPVPQAEAGGGGCSRVAGVPARLDPLLPGLVLLAGAALALRHRRGGPARRV